MVVVVMVGGGYCVVWGVCGKVGKSSSYDILPTAVEDSRRAGIKICPMAAEDSRGAEIKVGVSVGVPVR